MSLEKIYSVVYKQRLIVDCPVKGYRIGSFDCQVLCTHCMGMQFHDPSNSDIIEIIEVKCNIGDQVKREIMFLDDYYVKLI